MARIVVGGPCWSRYCISVDIRRVKERLSVAWNSCGFQVPLPLVAVSQAAQSPGHAVDSADGPTGGVSFQAAADQILAGSFALSETPMLSLSKGSQAALVMLLVIA